MRLHPCHIPFFFFLLILTGCGQTKTPESKYVLKNVDAKQAKMIVHYGQGGDGTGPKNLIVLDVRTPKEFAAGHIKGAVNHDYNAKEFAASLAGLDKSKELLVNCASGGRSTACLKTLEQAGFKKVYHLDGGIRAWRAAGNSVTKK